MFEERLFGYSALFTLLVRWHVSSVSLLPGDVIFVQLALHPEWRYILFTLGITNIFKILKIFVVFQCLFTQFKEGHFYSIIWPQVSHARQGINEVIAPYFNNLNNGNWENVHNKFVKLNLTAPRHSTITFSIMTIDIKSWCMTLNIYDTAYLTLSITTQPLCWVSLYSLSRFIYCYVEFYCAECRYDECHCAECRGTNLAEDHSRHW